MNCANHPDRERAAFCQNCGKPLCTECIRNVGSSIFCEPCYTAVTTGAIPPAGAVPPAGYGYGAVPPVVPPSAPGEPNPGIAALLGFIPGVGAMYNEQYAKGIVHLMVFALLVLLTSDVDGIFGLFIAGWVAYMVIEAHHTARARRDGTPLPNPFGLNDLSERLGFGKAWPGAGGPSGGAGSYTPPPGAPFTPPDASQAGQPYNYKYTYVPPVAQWGAPQGVPPVPPVPPYSDPNMNANLNPGYFHRFPSGAIWLIVLGVFFLVGRLPIFFIHGHVLAPMLMIGFGVWLFVSRMMSTGGSLENDGTHYYRWRVGNAVHRSVWIILTGVIWLLDALHILSWGHSWPIYLIAVGVLAIFRRTTEGPYVPYPAPQVYPGPAPPATPVTTTDLARTDTHSETGSGQEGR
jgi:TM2 domain-containing membrane protein YozV